jgi:release factor glutamine methyltransferase
VDIEQRDIEALRREKYDGNSEADLSADLARLSSGEPLAYVIGTIPFLGLTIHLDSHPLIPRPETEWWTELLINDINKMSDEKNPTIYGRVSILDLCAGSGAIGLAILKHCPNAQVSFGELVPEHAALIKKNIETNGLDASRADIRTGDLLIPFANEKFAVIATNPPYIPSWRTLPESVSMFEPYDALYAGEDGLAVINRIIEAAPNHLSLGGALWMECDTEHIADAHSQLLSRGFSKAEIRTDQYDRPRLLIALV